MMIKISRPTQKSIYQRHRLFEKLDHARDLPVIWLSAPAGAGKTTLVSSFIENRKIPCLWYQLDKSDEDLATFLLFHEIIHSAIPRIPAGMNIVVVSRSAPAPFVRLRANSYMELLRWDDAVWKLKEVNHDKI